MNLFAQWQYQLGLWQRFYCYIALGAMLSISYSAAAIDFLSLPQTEQHRIADLIYQNECNRQAACLVSWNDGENFASLGIGHFIWFPKDSKAPFKESFPDLMTWFEHKGIALPLALDSKTACLWANKDDFLALEHQQDIEILKQFLANTKSEQAAFMMSRLQQALPKMMAVTHDVWQRKHIHKQFSRVAASSGGWYALADYVNFKGEGIKPSEKYQGEGWGLAQVLLQMQGEVVGRMALENFSQAASVVLTRRVQLSPVQRNEKRWLEGWHKRLLTYMDEARYTTVVSDEN